MSCLGFYRQSLIIRFKIRIYCFGIIGRTISLALLSQFEVPKGIIVHLDVSPSWEIPGDRAEAPRRQKGQGAKRGRKGIGRSGQPGWRFAQMLPTLILVLRDGC